MSIHRTDATYDELVGYINAGGRGTRLNGLFMPDPKTGIAKALLEIGSPGLKLVDHHIANLRQQGARRIVVAAGDQRGVYEYVKTTYKGDEEVSVTRSDEQLGTGGDLISYARSSDCKNILIQNVDTVLDIDLRDFFETFNTQQVEGADACIALTLARGVPNQDAFLVGQDGSVKYSSEFDDKRYFMQPQSGEYFASSTGAVIVSADFLRDQAWQSRDGQTSLYKDALLDAWQQDGLYAYDNGTKFFRDIGTVNSWLESQSDDALQRQLRYQQKLTHSA